MSNVLQVVLLADLLVRHFPKECQAFLFNVLRWISMAEVWVYKNVRPLLVLPLANKGSLNTCILAVKDGAVVSNHLATAECDFLLFARFQSGEPTIYQKTREGLVDELELSDIKFVLTEVTVIDPSGEKKGDSMRVELKTRDYNYYVCGNMLDYPFFVYLLKTHYSVASLQPGDHLMVKMLDHNVDSATIHFTPTDTCKGILLDKSKYQLCLADTVASQTK